MNRSVYIFGLHRYGSQAVYDPNEKVVFHELREFKPKEISPGEYHKEERDRLDAIASVLLREFQKPVHKPARFHPYPTFNGVLRSNMSVGIPYPFAIFQDIAEAAESRFADSVSDQITFFPVSSCSYPPTTPCRNA